MFLPPSAVIASPAVSSEKFLRREVLANGLVLEFVERTNRYFGDYHRVCIEARTTLGLDHPALVVLDAALLTRARVRFGAAVTTIRTLERMGVEGERVAAVTEELIESFLLEAQRYFARPDYPERLLRAELERKPSFKSLAKPK